MATNANWAIALPAINHPPCLEIEHMAPAKPAASHKRTLGARS